MGLLDGGLASLFSTALSGLYLDATLHRATLTDNGKGGGSASFADQLVKAQLDRTIERKVDGVVDTYQRILVLASGLALITSDDEITVGDVRWSIADVSRDPAGAYFDLAGRKSGRQAAS